MTDLLNRIIVAHGGLDRWNQFSIVKGTIVTGGALWGMKGLHQDADPREMTVWLQQEKASVIPFGAPNQRTAFTPDRIAIETSDGGLVAERLEPRASFAGHEKTTAWDPLHRAYFNGYALWTYLTTPFLLTLPGVTVEELSPWNEAGETWHRLRARFSPQIATHSEVQDFFFGDDLLLRRHDYSVDVSGGFAAAQRVYDYDEADGIRFPTRRRAFLRGTDDCVVEDPLLVSINLSNVHFA
ncbi:hypothetical protein [Ensifer canadensis]